MGTNQEETEQTSGDGDASEPDTASIKDVSVEVNTVDYTLRKLRRLYRKSRRRPKGLKRLVAYLLNIPHITVIVTAVVFVLVVIIWSLLWVFVFRREYYGGAYFAGMFRVANMDFIPEYRQVESHEFVSMANKLQNVVSSVYRTSPVARLYKQAIISDLSNNNKGGLLNRSSIGYLLGLPVDIDSILINSVQRSDYTSSTGGSQCVDKLYANILGDSVPLSIYSSWGGVNCQVKLTSVPDSLIRLTITSFVIEPSDCVSDALTVYDALLPMRGRILHSLCEPVSSPVSIVSTSNIMLLSFRMTGDNKSFKGYFEAINDKVCLSQIETQSDGNIYSPFYPSLLPPKCSCTWKFKTPSPHLGVALRFQNYVLKAKDVQGCNNGWWKVNEVIFCGSYVGYHTVFRIDHPSPEVEFLCSSSSSAQPFQASYSSFNISHPCPESHFLCNTGICVEKSRLCDGLDDCADESDELFCCAWVYVLH